MIARLQLVHKLVSPSFPQRDPALPPSKAKLLLQFELHNLKTISFTLMAETCSIVLALLRPGKNRYIFKFCRDFLKISPRYCCDISDFCRNTSAIFDISLVAVPLSFAFSTATNICLCRERILKDKVYLP